MKITNYFACCIISCLLFACDCTVNVSKEKELGKDERKEIESEVREMLGAYLADIRLNGLKAEFEYLDSTDDFFWVPPGFGSAIDYDSVYAVISKNAGNFTRVDNKFETLTIKALGKILAVYTGRLKSTMTGKDGKSSEYMLLESGITRFSNGRWKLLSGQTTMINP